MIKFCRGETSQHIHKQVFHNFQKHQTTFFITYQTLENTISIMFWHLFGPNTFWRCWSKEPWKEIPPKQSPKKIYRRSPQIWKWEGPDNRFGGRLSGLALQYIAPSIMCTYSCSYWLFLSCSSGYCEKSKTAFTLQLYQQSVWEPDMLKVTQSPLPSIDLILLQYSSSDPVPQTGLTTGYTPPHEKTTNFVNKQL